MKKLIEDTFMEPEEHFKQLKRNHGDDWPEEALRLFMRMSHTGVVRNVPLYSFLYHWLVNILKKGYRQHVSEDVNIERAQRMLRDAKRGNYSLGDYVWLTDELFQLLDCQPHKKKVKNGTNKMTVVEQAEYALCDNSNFELRCALERVVLTRLKSCDASG